MTAAIVLQVSMLDLSLGLVLLGKWRAGMERSEPEYDPMHFT